MKARELVELLRMLDLDEEICVQLPSGAVLPIGDVEQRQSFKLESGGEIMQTEPRIVLIPTLFPAPQIMPVAIDDQFDVTTPAGFKKVAEIMRDVLFKPGEGHEPWRETDG